MSPLGNEDARAQVGTKEHMMPKSALINLCVFSIVAVIAVGCASYRLGKATSDRWWGTYVANADTIAEIAKSRPHTRPLFANVRLYGPEVPFDRFPECPGNCDWKWELQVRAQDTKTREFKPIGKFVWDGDTPRLIEGDSHD